MSKPFLLLGIWICLTQGVHAQQTEVPNDDIFPPAPTAASAVDFDGLGFMINGNRTFITSGSVHYTRVPQQDWRDILLKLKRAGFNTVETYVFWNEHEAKEGSIDFTTEGHNLGMFLDIAKEVGLYAIVRVGPYVCAEWENGGFPIWLYFKPGLEVRKDNKPYLDAVDAWYNKMLPIVAARQINRAGNVILVQLENELTTDGGRHWGTDFDSSYLQHLLDLAHQNGLVVPMYFSGLHHGTDPAPDKPVDHAHRKSPWMSSELWTTWFDKYGNSGEDLLHGERHPWRVLAHGGNGFNLYMFHGGTNFDFYNYNEDTEFGDDKEKVMASYDYGTLVGQGGDTRALYLRLKRLGYFAQSFSPILAGSMDATDQYQDFAQGATITARTSSNGTLVFLDNAAKTDTTALFKNGWSVRLAKGEIAAFALQVPLVQGLSIAEADTRILGIVPQDSVTTILCFGETGDKGRITFTASAPGTALTKTDAGFSLDASGTGLSFTFPDQGLGEEILRFGASVLRILVMNKTTADKTWIVDDLSGKQIVIGAPYLADFASGSAGGANGSGNTGEAGGSVGSAGPAGALVTVDYPWNDPAPTELTVYGSGDAHKIRLPAPGERTSPDELKASEWEMSPYTAPAAAGFNDRTWFTLPGGQIPEIGQDGDVTAYAWYRTSLIVESPITSLTFRRIGDRATFYLDGKRVSTYDLLKDKVPGLQLSIPAGHHSLAVFVAHAGRGKFYGYVGSLDIPSAQKGLRGPVKVNGGDTAVLTWRMKGGVDPNNLQLHWSSLVSPSAARAKSPAPAAAAAGEPTYFRTHLQLNSDPEPGAVYRLVTDGLSFGNVWINGHNVGRYPEILKDCPGIWLPACWLRKGSNTLVVFDEQGKSPTNVHVQLEAGASRRRITIKPEGLLQSIFQ
jgi:beta-galactosidase